MSLLHTPNLVRSLVIRRRRRTDRLPWLHWYDSHHDDVIKWKPFPHYWSFVRGIHWSPVNSPHKGQWRGALMVSLICAWINGWVNKREAGDSRRHCAYYDVTVMMTTHALFKTVHTMPTTPHTLGTTGPWFPHHVCTRPRHASSYLVPDRGCGHDQHIYHI